MRLALTLLLLPLVANADGKKPRPAFTVFEVTGDAELLAEHNEEVSNTPPVRFKFDQEGNAYYPGSDEEDRHSRGRAMPKKSTLAIAADQTSAWLAVDFEEHELFYDGPQGYVSPVLHKEAHAVVLVERGKDSGTYIVAAHVAIALDAKTQAKVEKDPFPSAMDEKVTAEAKPVADLFKTSIATPATLVATVSARADVVLYGSGVGERFVGGAAVKAQLQKWNLAMSATETRAELTSSKTVGWVATNVETRPLKSPKAAPITYRVLAIYEQTAGTWQLVGLSFSLVNQAFRHE